MKNLIKIYWLPTLLILGFSAIIFILLNREQDVVYLEPKIIQSIENESTKQKEIIREVKKEIIEIENSEKYISLRNKLDSLIAVKDTSAVTTDICYNTVVIQDSIIEKQKTVINSQDIVIQNDSIVKLQYIETISSKNIELKKADKKIKRSLWRGRVEGFVVGGVTGLIVGKVL